MAHYHVWHHPDFDGRAAFATVDLEVPTLDGSSTETKTFQSLQNDMDQLRADGASKGIVDDNVIEVGVSTEGRELLALKVGNGADHKVLFTGCHHAREWISVEVPFLVAKYLIDTYTSEPESPNQKRVKHLLDNRQIWFVPLVNPDGHAHTVLADRLWRPNRKEYVFAEDEEIAAPQLSGGPPRIIKVKAGSYRGVDLNRNYPTATWGQETVATSRDPADSKRGVWAGPSAGSEVETTAIAELIAAEGFRSSITYHNFSQLLLYPGAAEHDAFVQDVGRGMSKLIDANGNPYTYESGDGLYPTTGDLLEYAYGALPGRPTFTPELRPLESAPRSHYFSGLPEAEIEPTFKENLGAALALINCAGFDAPAARATIHWTPETRVAQVVRSCWKVFEGFTP